MLIEFTFSNFRSFHAPATLSMLAASLSSEDKSVDENNIIPILPGLNLLTSAAVYGANASGKSNLVAAMAFMRRLVLNSSRETQADEPIHVEPFRLSSVTEGQPACFEVLFLIHGQKYRYGFEATRERIQREWLYLTATSREGKLFTREEDAIQINPRSFREGRGLEKLTRPNALFLSVAAQFNGPIARRVQAWFRRLGIISGLSDLEYQGFTIDKFMSDAQHREDIKRFVCSLDLDIENIDGEKVNPENIAFPKDMPEEIKAALLKGPGEFVTILTEHKKYDGEHNPIGVEHFTLEGNESEGTKKLFYLAGPLLDTLLHGRVMLIDEMEARLHPLINTAIIRLFNSLQTNPKRSQLIFTTHDTNLLDRALFRRDQIWFAEKDRYGSSHLYSLVEFKPRNDASFEKDYLRGRYGAVPYPGGLTQVIQGAASVAEEKTEYEV
jgi:AAA15 family ATPase/GTPase